MMGKTLRLKALRETDHGFYLTDGTMEVLLPRREVDPKLRPGDELEVFLYRDSEDRPTATIQKPFAQVDEVALLEIVDQTPFGSFARWGLLKDLLIPLNQQQTPLQVGQSALVLVLLDEQSDRIYGTTKVAAHLEKDLSDFRLGQEVQCIVWKPHELGWSVLVEGRWQGIVYLNEMPKSMKIGERFSAWISALRPDGKIDLKLRPIGFAQANDDARSRILEALQKAGGKLSIGDKSSPETIFNLLGLSKKAFKAACGTLYKEKKIVVEDLAIRLL